MRAGSSDDWSCQSDEMPLLVISTCHYHICTRFTQGQSEERSSDDSHTRSTTTDICLLLLTSPIYDLEFSIDAKFSCGGSKPVSGLPVLLPPPFKHHQELNQLRDTEIIKRKSQIYVNELGVGHRFRCGQRLYNNQIIKSVYRLHSSNGMSREETAH